MKGIKWIKDLQNFQFQTLPRYSQNYTMAFSSLKADSSVHFMAYFFPLEDEMAHISLIKTQIDIYQKISSRYLAKISHAALLNGQEGHRLVLMHQISKGTTIIYKVAGDCIGIIQDMLCLLKGINKLHSAGLFHGLMRQFNIFRNDKRVYLGLPFFHAIFKPKIILHEDAQLYQRNKRALQREDIQLFGRYLENILEYLEDKNNQYEIPHKMCDHLQIIVQKIKHSDIQLIEVYTLIKKMIANTRVQFDIKYDLFLGENKPEIIQSHLWEKVCTQYIQEHFQVCIRYRKEQIRISVVSQKLPHLCFNETIDSGSFHYQHIESMLELYSLLVSKFCKISIDSQGCINFAVCYDKKGFYYDPKQEKMKREEVDLQYGLKNMEHLIELLVKAVEQKPKDLLHMNEWRQKVKEQLKDILGSKNYYKISKEFQGEVLSRLNNLK